MRDITLGETVDFKFTTAEPDTGAPATLAGTPVISAYVGNSTTQITAGITLTVDFDGVTGLHNVRVVATTGNGYTDGSDVALIITTGTVDSVSAVGYKVAEFTIGRSAANSALKPVARAAYLVDTTIATLASQTSFTLTAGSADNDAYNGMAFIFTDVTTAVQKGVAFASDYVGSTRTVTLEAGPIFTIATTDLVTIVPAGGSTSLPPAVNVTQVAGAAVNTASAQLGVNVVNAAGTAWGSGAITAASIAADAITAAKIADNAIDAGSIAANAITSAKIATGAITSAAFAAGAIDAAAIAANAIGASELAADAVTEIAAGVLAAAAADPIDANVEQINTVAITGNGGVGTEFSV
jgi:hypothetical protein